MDPEITNTLGGISQILDGSNNKNMNDDKQSALNCNRYLNSSRT